MPAWWEPSVWATSRTFSKAVPGLAAMKSMVFWVTRAMHSLRRWLRVLRLRKSRLRIIDSTPFMKWSLTMALRRTVRRKMRIKTTVMTDITPSGYIMMPPLARISRKFISLTAGTGVSAAAEATSAERKKTATEKWQHFMKMTGVYRCKERTQARDGECPVYAWNDGILASPKPTAGTRRGAQMSSFPLDPPPPPPPLVLRKR